MKRPLCCPALVVGLVAALGPSGCASSPPPARTAPAPAERTRPQAEPARREAPSKVAQCNALNTVINRGSADLKATVPPTDPESFLRVARKIEALAAEIRAVALVEARLRGLQDEYHGLLGAFAKVFTDLADALKRKDTQQIGEIQKRLDVVVRAEKTVIDTINDHCKVP